MFYSLCIFLINTNSLSIFHMHVVLQWTRKHLFFYNHCSRFGIRDQNLQKGEDGSMTCLAMLSSSWQLWTRFRYQDSILVELKLGLNNHYWIRSSVFIQEFVYLSMQCFFSFLWYSVRISIIVLKYIRVLFCKNMYESTFKCPWIYKYFIIFELMVQECCFSSRSSFNKNMYSLRNIYLDILIEYHFNKMIFSQNKIKYN